MAQAPQPLATTDQPASWDDYIRYQAKQQGIAPALALAVMRKESGGNVNALGDAGDAIGFFQLHEGAASDVGLTPEERLNPQKNIEGGARYLRLLNDRYKGDVNKMLMAYNGGMGNVDSGTISPQAQAYAAEVMARLSQGLRTGVAAPTAMQGGRASGAGPVVQQPGAPAGPGPAAGSITTTLPTPDVQSFGQQILAPYNLKTPEGRLNVAATVGGMAGAAVTGGMSAMVAPATARVLQVLGPIIGAGSAGAAEVATENVLSPLGPPRNPLKEGAVQGGYEALGQGMAWPLARVARTAMAPGLVRATRGALVREGEQVTASSRAAVTAMQSKVDEALDLAKNVRDVGVLRGPGAAAKLADVELEGAAGLANVAKQYDDLLRNAPSALGVGELVGATLEGPTKRAFDLAKQRVADAAKGGPAIEMTPIADTLDDLAAKVRPSSIYGEQDAETAGIGFLRNIQVAARPAAATVQPAEMARLNEAVAQALGIPVNQMDPKLPGLLGRIQSLKGKQLTFEEAHTLKRALDDSINYTGDYPKAHKQLQSVTRQIRAALRDEMTGYEPYDNATAAFQSIADVYRKGIGKQMIRYANTPDGAIQLATALKNGDAAKALTLKQLLIDQATAGGNEQAGRNAWAGIRSIYTNDKLLQGGIGGLQGRLDDLLTQRPEFVRAVYHDEPGQLVLQNIGRIADAYQHSLSLLKQSGAAAVSGAKAAGELAKQGVEAKAERFSQSSLAKFTRQTQAGIEADMLRFGNLGLRSIWGAQSAIRLLSSPKAADVLEWAAYSNYNANRLVKLLTGPVPPEFFANVMREAAGVIVPPATQGRITATGTEAR